MAVNVSYQSNVTVNETLDTNAPGAAAAKAVIVHDQYNTSATLNASSSVPATKAVFFSQALTGGAATIDLTAVTGLNNMAMDSTGLKVQVAKFKNPAGNAAMTITEGATNGYELAGNTFKFILLAGQEVLFYGNEATPDVGASAKTIDITGTGTEALEVSFVMG